MSGHDFEIVSMFIMLALRVAHESAPSDASAARNSSLGFDRYLLRALSARAPPAQHLN
jgi:hypothetical protein